MFPPQEPVGARGARVQGPPWILGHRGAPREAPENTLASLRRAVEHGADGVAYDLRACASGELVLLADPALERTSDAHGLLAARTLPELFGVDAGGWFDRRFAGEPLALLEEVLELEGNHAGRFPQHLALLRETGLTGAFARALKGVNPRLSVRVGSPLRGVCLEVRDLGLQPLLVAERLDEDLRRFVEDERVAAVGASARAWRAHEAEALAQGRSPPAWRCERWALRLDDPEDLLWAARRTLNALTTTEPGRALATRALARLAPADEGPYPLAAPPLPIDAAGLPPSGAEWCGRWETAARLRNPLPFRVRAAVELVVRRGAFEAEGLPAALELEPGAEAEVPFRLTGGSWSPGGDPLLYAHVYWQRGPGRPEEHLALDAPLRRVRELVLAGGATRLELLRERPGDPPASVTVRRRGRALLVALENPGGLEDARTLAHLDGADHAGGAGLRLVLPEDCDVRPGGVPFSAGLMGVERGPRGSVQRVRRWAGGVPGELGSGAPGVLRTRT